MRILILFCMMVMVLAVKDVKYSAEEVQTIMEHMDCFLDRGPCDGAGQSYKDEIPEAIRTSCATCTEARRLAAYTFNVEAPYLFPEDHQEFRKRYDPTGNFDSFMTAITPQI